MAKYEQVAELDIPDNLPGTRGASPTLAHPAKRAAVYLFIFILAAFAITALFTFNIKWGATDQVKRIFFVTFFLLLGICHLFSFSKWLPDMYFQDRRTSLFYSLLLTLLTGVAAFLVFGFTAFEKSQLAVAAALSFLFPTAVSQAWAYFDSIFTNENLAWYLPTTIPKKTTIYLNSLQIKVRIKINYFDLAERTFMVAAPGHLHLGDMFYQFLVEREREGIKIQLADQGQQSYAWRFLLQRPLIKKMLDPEATIGENGIKEKEIVLAERIKIA